MTETIKECFIISPIGKDNTEKRIHADRVLKEIIEPAIDGYCKAVRSDRIARPGRISDQMIEYLANDIPAIVDLTYLNPNVFYELALRHVTAKPYIQLIMKGHELPFDVFDTRAIEYSYETQEEIEKAINEIMAQIKAIQEQGMKPEERLFKLFDFNWSLRLIDAIMAYAESVDFSRSSGDTLVFRERKIKNLDASKSKWNNLTIENVIANRVDLSGAKIRNLLIKNSSINMLDLCCKSKIGEVTIKNSRINIADAWKGKLKRINAATDSHITHREGI